MKAEKTGGDEGSMTSEEKRPSNGFNNRNPMGGVGRH
jgi:hypothetical protein